MCKSDSSSAAASRVVAVSQRFEYISLWRAIRRFPRSEWMIFLAGILGLYGFITNLFHKEPLFWL